MRFGYPHAVSGGEQVQEQAADHGHAEPGLGPVCRAWSTAAASRRSRASGVRIADVPSGTCTIWYTGRDRCPACLPERTA